MAVLRPPSKYIMRKAWQLGRKMAIKERRIRPNFTNSHQYTSYDLFQQFHRHMMECNAAFPAWDERIEALAEREANAQGVRIDIAQNWEAYHRRIVGPICNAFWIGWEESMGVEPCYRERRNAEVERHHTKLVMQVRQQPDLPRPVLMPTVEEEASGWAKIEDRLASGPLFEVPEDLTDNMDANSVFAPIQRPESSKQESRSTVAA